MSDVCSGAEFYHKSDVGKRGKKPTGAKVVFAGKFDRLIFCTNQCLKHGCECMTIAYNSDTKDCIIYAQTVDLMSYENAKGFEIFKFIRN